MQDRYRSGGGRQGGGRYPQGGGGRRRRGGRRPHEFPEFQGGPESEEFGAPELELREPNPDADELHLAYDSVYTHEGDVREELLEKWVEESQAGKRWRCWNCNRVTQRFTQLRFPTFRTVVSICDNCSMWTVWDAWRDIANPRMFTFRRTIEKETAPAPVAEPSAVPGVVENGARDNGAHSTQPAAVEQPSPPAPPVSSQPGPVSLPPAGLPVPSAESQPEASRTSDTAAAEQAGGQEATKAKRGGRRPAAADGATKKTPSARSRPAKSKTAPEAAADEAKAQPDNQSS